MRYLASSAGFRTEKQRQKWRYSTEIKRNATYPQGAASRATLRFLATGGVLLFGSRCHLLARRSRSHHLLARRSHWLVLSARSSLLLAQHNTRRTPRDLLTRRILSFTSRSRNSYSLACRGCRVGPRALAGSGSPTRRSRGASRALLVGFG